MLFKVNLWAEKMNVSRRDMVGHSLNHGCITFRVRERPTNGSNAGDHGFGRDTARIHTLSIKLEAKGVIEREAPVSITIGTVSGVVVV